jgi:hypothetical protein
LVVINFLGCAGGTYPAGIQPAAGSRTIAAPTIMKQK